MSGMFSDCSAFATLDLSGFDTSSVTYTDMMFSGCSSLTALDLSALDTSTFIYTTGMFNNCSSLESLDLSGWNTERVEDMGGMFHGCSSLTSLDLSSFDTSNAKTMGGMYMGCSSLERIAIGSGYHMASENAFPDATNARGAWWSLADHRWYAKQDVVNARSGIADTYVSRQEPGYKIPVTSLAIAAPAAQTYTGRALTPAPTVRDGGLALKRGTDYTLSYASNVNAGTAKVTVTGVGNYEGSVTRAFRINKAPQTITGSNKTVAMGKTAGLGARRTAGNGKLTYKSSNAAVAKVSATGVVTPVKVGRATVTITAAATANYKAATKKVTVTVTKGAQPMAVKSVARVAPLKTLKLKSVTVARPLSYVKAPRGKVTYAKVSGSAALSISRTTGKVTVRKGTKKGTYYIKVKVAAAGDANWRAGNKTLTCKVVVK